MADVKVTIDGIDVTVPKGTFLIQAAKSAGIYISNFCAHPDMRPFGACRMCTVGVVSKWGLGFDIACATECKDGMVAFTENSNDEVREVKKFIMESLLVDHPLDCPICPASGACDLQNATWHYGMTENRMAREKQWMEQDYLSPAILIKRDRCVVCGQCVRVCDELIGAHALAFVNRGIATYIDSAWGSDLTKSPCTSCGLCVEVCPVGCLMHVEYENAGLQWTMKRTPTTCNYCAVGCSMNLEVENNTGIIEKVTMAEGIGVNDGRSCVKGRYGYQYANNEDRLLTPLMRKGHEFVEISWNEAYNEIVKRLNQYTGEQFGAIVGGKTTNEENYLMQKLTRGLQQSNNIDNPIRFTQAASITALEEQLGFSGMTNTIQDIKDFAGCYFITGADLDVSAPVMAYLLQEAIQRRKVATIVVNPRRVEFANRATLYLQIRPGTDAALYNGLAHIIVKEGWQAASFVDSRVEGFEAWKASLNEWTPERTSQVTGIAVEDLYKAAQLYAQGGAHTKPAEDTGLYPPSAIIYATGVTQWINGVDNVHALANLALLTGNLGRQGAGLNGVRDMANDQGASDMGCLPDYLPGYVPVSNAEARAALETLWFGRSNGRIPATPGLSYMEMFKAAEQGSLKMMWVMGENPMLSGSDLQQVQRGLEKLEFLVVQDLFLTETCRFADIILPASAHAEKDGTYTNTERRVQRVSKGVASPGFARADWKILSDIMDRPGLRAKYKHPSEIMVEISQANRYYNGVRYEKLNRGRGYKTFKPGLVYNQLAPMVMERAGLQWPATLEGAAEDGTTILFSESFPTSSGKARFVPATQPERKLPAAEELILCVGRSSWGNDRSGSLARRNYVMDAIDPEPELELSIPDMTRYGLNDGDIVKVESERGSLEIKVKTNVRQPVGVGFMPWMFREAPGAVLTSTVTDPRTGSPEFKYTPVTVQFLRKSVSGLITPGAGLQPEVIEGTGATVSKG
ncbi:MAG TPA: molybdopterin-dependent oxidoreductase [Chloroflexia bacterium]|nr:molybdopterin-dependent oxidoreductase [Chloroflexia bacterium]